MSLRLDEPEMSWASQIDRSDLVVLSAGIWLFWPLLFHENSRVVGCNWESCEKHNTTHLDRKYGFQKVFQTTFRTLLQPDCQGITFFRTYSLKHFENGQWNMGGTCMRNEPFARINATTLIFDRDGRDANCIPVEEFNAVEKVAKERGLKLKLLDTTKMMQLRPDGHPNFYRNLTEGNESIADCVHWW